MKHVSINASINQSHDQEFIVQQGPDHIDAAFRIVIMLSEASLPDRRVAMSPRHILSESALIYIYQSFFIILIFLNLAAESIS